MSHSLKSWAPVNIEFSHTLPVVKWRDLRTIDLVDPFFYLTVDRVRKADTQGEVTTGIDELLRLEKSVDSVPPTGFIFHVSRCGSTLIANALRTLDRTIMMSEPQPISAAVWLHFDNKENSNTHDLFRSFVLKASLRALGQRVTGSETRYFVKFANVDILQFKHIRRLWPDVPWVFIMRNPEEVIVSNMRKESSWIRIESRIGQAAMMLGCNAEDIPGMSREEYGARMIGRICCEAAESATDDSLFIDYTTLTTETLVKIVRFFGIEPTSSELSSIYGAGSVYSKDPTRTFQPDSEVKQREASALIRSQSERWAMDGYLKALAVANRHSFR